MTAAPASTVAVVDDSTAGTPTASAAASGSSADGAEQWESDSSSRWGDSTCSCSNAIFMFVVQFAQFGIVPAYRGTPPPATHK